MKILVVGRGWIGNKVFNEFNRRGILCNIVSHETAFTITDNYDWVVNCAGITGVPNVDACENNKYETIKANSVYPVILKKFSESIGAKYAHFSSGCIYQGEVDNLMAEPNFFGSTYSISKGVSDSYLKHNSLVLRIRMPFTGVNDSRNFLSKIIKYAKTGKLIEGGPNSISDLDEAVKVTCDLIESEKSGPYNLVNSGYVTMHDAVKLLGINAKWFTPEEFGAVTSCKRSNCVIIDSGLMVPVEEALERRIKQL